MEEIQIVYIDDAPDTKLSKFLDTQFKDKDYDVKYSELMFLPTSNYESLLQNELVRKANLIFIDSKLFEQSHVGESKFTGEEFKLLLKKFYPFIEVVVITQNPPDNEAKTISKFSSSRYNFDNADTYYTRVITPIVDEAVSVIKAYRHIAQKINVNQNIEIVLREKVLESLQGTNTYDELTKTDIDSLIETFKKVQEKIDERLQKY